MSEPRDNQIRRTARVLEIVQQITTAPCYWTRKKLAEYHEISERMIQKDLELIRVRLGLPIHTNGEGYYFRYLPQLPSTLFTFSEAIALLSAARAAQALPGINSSDLSAAIGRLEAIFPNEIRPILKESLDHLPKSAVKAHRQRMLALFNRSYYERKQIDMIYQSQKGREGKRRLVEPYLILPYGRSWHLIAYDHLRKDILQFKLDRVLEAHLTDETYVIPASFDLDEYLGDSWGLMRGAALPVEEVILVFDETAGRWVSEEHWHKSQQIDQNEDGSFQVVFNVGITPEMVNWLLYYGPHVRIIKPVWLREKVAEEHRSAVNL